MDVRTVEAGDTAPGGGTIEIEPAIEVGNIFKLGTRYSEPLGATYLDEDGSGAADRDGQLRDRPGPDRRRGDRAARRRARHRLAAVARALAGPPRLARQGRGAGARGRRPALRGAARGRRRGPLRRPRRRAGGEADRRRAARLPAADRRRPPRPRQGRRRGHRARRRRRARAARGGGRRRGRWRSSRASMAEHAPPSAAAACAASSGSTAAARPPPQTRKGEPLNPWTIPNLVGYLRLAALPVFLYLAFETERRAPRSPPRWSSG